MSAPTLALWLLAQAPAPVVPVIAVETALVHVEAVVTDRKGRPIRDLTRDDFTLFVDGLSIPIALFDPPSASAATQPAAAATAAAPAGIATPAPIQAPLLVLHVDADNLTPAGRQRALAGLGEWVAEILARQPTRVLVTTADPGVRLLAPITSDAGQVARALEQAAAAPVHGRRRMEEERTVRETVMEVMLGAESTLMTCVDVLRIAQSAVEFHARSREMDQLRALEGLAGLVAALGTVPGTKALVYLTEGLEQRPGVHLFDQLGDMCSAAGPAELSALAAAATQYDLTRPLQDLAARANAARVTLYPVDAAGLVGLSTADPSQQSRRFTPSARNDAVLRANLRAAPGILADETGGVAVAERNRPVTGLEALERDLESRYAIGFTPPTPPDGRRHELRLELRKRGLNVRHRLSYWHAEAGDQHVNRTWAALLLGHEEDDLGAVAELADGAAAGELALRLRLQLAKLTAEAGAQAPRARLRVVIAVGGEGRGPGVRHQAREKTIDVPLDSTAPGEWREVVVRLPFPRGETVLGLGLLDLLGGRATYRRLLLRAAPPS